MEKYWEKLLRENLLPHPAKSSRDPLYRKEKRNDFFIPRNVKIRIKTKNKIYDFTEIIGTPYISLRKDEIQIVFPSDTKKIKWDKIVRIDFSFYLLNKA